MSNHQTKPKMGRPPIPIERKRVNLGTTVTQETLSIIKQLGAEEGLSTGQVLDAAFSAARSAMEARK